MMGFGRSGGAIDGGFGGLPLHWRWGDGPYQAWMGSLDVGARLKLTGPEPGWAAPSYSYGANPPTWDNHGAGGANVTRAGGAGSAIELVAFTGPVTIAAGQKLELHFELLLTPVKPLNRGLGHPHWRQRHYQVGYGGPFATPAEVAATGATIAVSPATVGPSHGSHASDADSCCRQNLHQGIAAGPVPWPGHTDVQEGLLNPYINWPVRAISLPLSPQSEQDRAHSSSRAPSSLWRTTPRRLRSWEYRPRCTTQSASAHLSAPLARSDHLQSGSGL